MLSDEMNCEEADKLFTNYLTEAHKAYTVGPKGKTYFSFHTFNGKLFLQTDKKY